MIDEINNVSPKQVIATTNNVFDKNSENAKSAKSIKELGKQQPKMSSKMAN